MSARVSAKDTRMRAFEAEIAAAVREDLRSDGAAWSRAVYFGRLLAVSTDFIAGKRGASAERAEFARRLLERDFPEHYGPG